MITPKDRQRLGDQVRRARGSVPLTEAAARAQVSPTTWRGVENGTAATVRATTYRSIEQVLGWESGSVTRILEGGEPTPLAGAPHAPSAGSVEVDHIVAWENELIDEVWSNPHLTDQERQDLTEKIRVKAAEARAIQDRLRRSSA